jgi:hypothetical protein
VITLGKDGARLVSTLPLKFSAAQNAMVVCSHGASQATRASKFWTTPSPIQVRPRATVSSVWTPNPWWWMPHAMLWVSDEYGPFIVKIDPATGIILKKYKPGTGSADLPAILAKRRANRGMEGLSIDVASGKLHGFLQSPLNDGADYTTAAVPMHQAPAGKRARLRPLCALGEEFDPTSEKTRLFALPVDGSWCQPGQDRQCQAR